MIDSKELTSPLIGDLKKQIAALNKTNSELNSGLLEAKQKANTLEAELELIKENEHPAA